MGIKSTVDITREEAIETIVDRVHYATNDQIASALEALVGDDLLANYRIVNPQAPCHPQYAFPNMAQYLYPELL